MSILKRRSVKVKELQERCIIKAFHVIKSRKENGVTRPKKYYELSAMEAIQADCYGKTTNIILQGLPTEVYALVSNHKVTKELWKRIQLLMQETSLTKQEREDLKIAQQMREINTKLFGIKAHMGIHGLPPCVKNLVPIPSEYEVTSDDENECEVPVKDGSSPVFTTFSNPIFHDNDDFTSSDDESLSDEDVPIEDFKVYSNPLFDDDEINSDDIGSHYFNVEADLIESLSNHNTLFYSSLKFDYLEEFYGEFIPTNIVNEECIRREHEEYISLMEKLLAINSFPRMLENFHANTIVETLPTSPILIEDSDSQRKEIDTFNGTDDLLPPGIESDDYDSEGDIHFLKELLGSDTPSLSKNESSNFDHHDDPSFPHPPPEPPDVEFYFDLEPDLEEVISDELNEDECFDPGGEINVFTNVEDDDYFPFIFVIRIFLPYLVFPEVYPLLLSVGSEDTIFDPGISI
nr:hypothetical protein [Tanacetum cinerariifolium]